MQKIQFPRCNVRMSDWNGLYKMVPFLLVLKSVDEKNQEKHIYLKGLM